MYDQKLWFTLLLEKMLACIRSYNRFPLLQLLKYIIVTASMMTLDYNLFSLMNNLGTVVLIFCSMINFIAGLDKCS